MPLESASTIAELQQTYPLGGDVTLQGDDHLRLIKSVLKLQFPGGLGDGLNAPVIASEDEFSYLVGVTSSIQDQFDALGVRVDGLEAALNAPAGTRLTFHQAAPPLGWTQDATVDDSMMRVVSGVGGATGGTDSAITHLHTTADHQLTVAEMPAHNHSYNMSQNSAARDPSGLDVFMVNVSANTGSKGGDLAHNHGNTGLITPKYHDMVIGVKD